MNFTVNSNFFYNWSHNWKDRSLCSMVQNDDSGSVRARFAQIQDRRNIKLRLGEGFRGSC